MRGLYTYEAQGEDEIAVTVGGIITLTASGESYGNGWYEGVDSNGKQVRVYVASAHLHADARVVGCFPQQLRGVRVNNSSFGVLI